MNRFFAVANLRKGSGRPVNFVSAYFKYSISTQEFTRNLGHILERIRENVVIGADVNAHSSRWFSHPGNHSGQARGTRVVNLIDEKLLTIYNLEGNPDTYYREGIGSSNIDLTLTKGRDMERAISQWKVLVDLTESDHRMIEFKVSCGW